MREKPIQTFMRFFLWVWLFSFLTYTFSEATLIIPITDIVNAVMMGTHQHCAFSRRFPSFGYRGGCGMLSTSSSSSEMVDRWGDVKPRLTYISMRVSTDLGSESTDIYSLGSTHSRSRRNTTWSMSRFSASYDGPVDIDTDSESTVDGSIAGSC